MTVWQRIGGALVGLLSILLGVIMLIDSELGFDLVCAILCLALLVYGIKSLIYYQTMARHMVGGRMMLYRGMVLFSLGVFTLTISNIPKAYIILYIMGMHAFAGIVDVLRANEAKKMGVQAWKGSLFYGLGNITMAVLSISYGFLTKSITPVVTIYSLGLMYSGVVKIATSFRKTAVVYIQ